MSRPNRGRLERSARNLLVLYLVWSERDLPKSSRRLRIHPKKKRGRTSTEPFPFRLQHHVPFLLLVGTMIRELIEGLPELSTSENILKWPAGEISGGLQMMRIECNRRSGGIMWAKTY